MEIKSFSYLYGFTELIKVRDVQLKATEELHCTLHIYQQATIKTIFFSIHQHKYLSAVIRPIKHMQTNKNCTDKIQKCLCKFNTYTSQLQKFNDFTSNKAEEKKFCQLSFNVSTAEEGSAS